MHLSNIKVKTFILFLIGACSIVHANPIMIDFGTTTGVSGAVGPAHHEGTISSSETTWISADSHASLIPATLGRETTQFSKIIDWSTPSSLFPIPYTATPGGVFDNGILGDSLRSPSNGFGLAFKFDLSPGTYSLYYTGNSSLITHKEMVVYAGVISDTDVFTDFSLFDSTLLENTNNTSFQLDDNYARFDLTVGHAQSIALIIKNNRDGGNIGESVISSVKITGVPEPSTYALLALGLISLGVYRKRK